MDAGPTPPGWSDEQVAALRATAAAAWPELPPPEASFIERIAELTGDGGPAAAEALRIGDLYLAHLCARGDERAIELFERECDAAITMAVQRVQTSKHSPDDLRQIILSQLFLGDAPKVRAYGGKGPLQAWTGVVALRAALNAARGKHREVSVGGADQVQGLESLPDPELDYLRRKYRADFGAAFAAAVRELSARDRSLLRQHLVEKLSVRELGRVYSVNSGTISRWIIKAREAVAARTCEQLRTTLDVTPAELESIMAVIRSRVDLSITRVFADVG